LWKKKNVKRKQSVDIEYMTEIDNQSYEFMKCYQKKELFIRDANTLNWMLKYPWIINAPLQDKMEKKYYFSSTADMFNFYAYKVYNYNEKLIGVVILKKRLNKLEVPYIYYKEKYLDKVVYTILKHAIGLKAANITSCRSDVINEIINQKFPIIFKKKIAREYLIPSCFNKIEAEEYVYQDGDGDLAFT